MPTLEQRLRALEQIVGQFGPSETLVPNYLNLSPTGLVSPSGPFLQLQPSGDQSGAVDLAELLAALAIGVPATIFLATGDWYFGATGSTAAINIPDGIRITGEGSATKVHTDRLFIGGNNVEIDHIQFVTRTNLMRNANGYPTVNASANLRFTGINCSAHDLTGDGLVIEFNGATGFECWSNAFAAGFSSMGGIQTFNAASQGRVWGNRITGSNHNGIGLNNSNNITLGLNDCYSNQDSGVSPQNGCTAITVIGNRCHGNGADGIDLNSGLMSAITDFLVVANHSESNGATGIYAVGSRNSFIANKCVNNGTWNFRIAAFGADVSNATNVLLVGNNAATGAPNGAWSLANLSDYIAWANYNLTDSSASDHPFGSVTLTFGGVNNFTSNTVAYSLPSTPRGFHATPSTIQPGGAQVAVCAFNVTNAGATIQARTVDGSVPANATTVLVWWHADL